jgi:hypothetical protein
MLGTEFLPVNITDLIGITGSMLLVLIPVIGLTVRFAAKPFVEALLRLGVGQAFERQQVGEVASSKELAMLTRRVLELEQELDKLKGQPGRQLAAVADVSSDGSVTTRESRQVR